MGVIYVICAIVYVVRKTRAKIGTARTVVSFPDPHVLPRERESVIVLPGQLYIIVISLPFHLCISHSYVYIRYVHKTPYNIIYNIYIYYIYII